MKKIFGLVLVLIAVCAVYGCGFAPAGSFSLHETPQMYVLQNGNLITNIPTVILYKNGNARFEPPSIISHRPSTMGWYEVSGDELTVTQDNFAAATFMISDKGNTLTLQSISTNHAETGAVYRYIPSAEYLRYCLKADGQPLTVDALRELGRKAPNLAMSDFETYAHYTITRDMNIFDVDGEFILQVTECADGSTPCIVKRNTTGETFPLHLEDSTNQAFDAFLGPPDIPENKP